MRLGISSAILILLVAVTSFAQARKPAAPSAPAKTQAAKPSGTKSGPVEITCPAVLGTGVTTKRVFCDVLTGVDPKEGILIPMPSRTGPTTLTLDLHSRHTYSESQTQAGRAYARYSATVVFANLKGEILGRASVMGEFRSEADLLDRVSGGAGPGGVKAVAPVGTETVVFSVPDDVTEVVVLGERLTIQRVNGREVFSSAGRPVALLSNPTLEYRPKPPPRRTTRRRR